jgi:hypothetical protein
MRSELEQRLHVVSKNQLVQLLQELALRHPALLTEMLNILENLTGEEPGDVPEDIDGEVSEDWDFSGDEQEVLRPAFQAAPLPHDSQTQQRSIEEYASRLRQEVSPQLLVEILTALSSEALAHIEHDNYHAALDLFALLFDERLLERTPGLTSIFDEVIDATTPSLETLLSEASSNTMFDANIAALSPLLTLSSRQCWLERLFALWLKRLDAHRVEKNFPELMLDVAWNEDIELLRNLAQNELQRQPHGEHYQPSRQDSNIVDFARQYRTKALEKFLKELPRT